MNNDIEILFKNLKGFIGEDFGIKTAKILITSRIEKDLGIYGDDAVDLLVAYGAKFGVNISNFLFADYFNSEGGHDLSYFILKDGKKELTIKHLILGILAGKLEENIIQNE